MKKNFYLLFLFTALFASAYANVVTVKGNVKLSDGSPAKNVEVKIAVFLASATTSCSEQTVVTNENGLYTNDLTCQGDIKRTRIVVKNCDGALLVQEKEVPTTKIVEANFIVCMPAPPPPPPPTVPCAAKFTAEPAPVSSTIPAFTFKFNSNISAAAPGDDIVHRVWDFHDGTPLLNDRVDPLHTFPHAGTYEVCLTIKTAKGCESRICKQIVIQQAVPPCAARFTFERLGPKKFRFNSTSSLIASNDQIVETKWDFHDGTTSTDVSPAHEFPKAGNYEVCLAIKTALGCESRFCIVVKAEEVASTDNALVKIVSLYPSPVHETLKAVVFSRKNNIPATISIVSTSAMVEMTKQLLLVEGNTPLSIDVRPLPVGSYFFKVTTQFGTVSKPFYKL